MPSPNLSSQKGNQSSALLTPQDVQMAIAAKYKFIREELKEFGLSLEEVNYLPERIGYKDYNSNTISNFVTNKKPSAENLSDKIDNFKSCTLKGLDIIKNEYDKVVQKGLNASILFGHSSETKRNAMKEKIGTEELKTLIDKVKEGFEELVELAEKYHNISQAKEKE